MANAMSANFCIKSPSRENRRSHFLTLICFLSILVFGCTRSSSFSREEERILTHFFQELLLEHGGAYTLFGSKPATIENLLEISPQLQEEIQSYLKAHPEISSVQVERHLEEGWEILKRKPLPFSSRFILTEVNCGDYSLLVFLNREKTLSVLHRYPEEFRKVVGNVFQPKQAIEDLRRGNHEIWKKIFQNPVCKGILLGYGIENARLFQTHRSKNSYLPSENNDPRIQPSCVLQGVAFRLPIFVMFHPEESAVLLSQYKQERRNILQIYEGQDFLKRTLAEWRRGETSSSR